MYYKTYLNGDLVYQTLEFQETNTEDVNLAIMGQMKYQSYEYSLFGRMSDVNIWNRSFSDDEIIRWTHGKDRKKGNVLEWNPDLWNKVGLDEVMIDENAIYRKTIKSLLFVSEIKRNVDETISFCTD